MVSTFADRLQKSVIPGFGVKTPCLAASTGNITISGSTLATIDGMSPSSGDRVLLWQQNSTRENGVYKWTSTTTSLTRDADFDGNTDVVAGTMVLLRSGGLLYGSKFAQVTSTGTGANGAHVFSGNSSTSDIIVFTMLTVFGSTGVISSTATYLDTALYIAASSGSTNTFRFGASALTAAGRVMTIPDADSNLVGTTNAQTLTNKTIDGANNTLTVRSSADLTGNLPVARFNGAASASTNTFWRGDGTWGTVTSTLGGTITAISHSSGVGGGVITSSGDVGLDFSNLPTAASPGATLTFLAVYASSTAQHFKMLPSALPGLSAGGGPSLFAYPAIAGGIF